MKKILIVDDEQLIRIGLISLLAWESYGYTIVGDASNGEEALHKIEELKPDIVLVDLKMDPIDGFEVIRDGLQKKPDLKFIALSNYNDFDSARKAMKLGASDYIFKLTLKAEELIQVLDEVSAEISGKEERKDDKQAENEPRWSQKENILRHILDYGEDAVECLANIQTEVSFEAEYWVLFLRINNFKTLRKAGNYPNLLLVKNTLEKVILEILGRQFVPEIFRYRDSEFAVVLNGRFSNSFEHAERSFTVLNNYSKQYYGFTLCGGLSSSYTKRDSFSTAINEAHEHMKQCFLPHEQMVQAKQQCEPALAVEERYSVGKIEERIKCGEVSEAFQNLLQFMEEISKKSQCSGENVKHHITKIIQVLIFGMIKYQIEPSQVVDQGGITLGHVLYEYDTLEAVQRSVIEISEQVKAELTAKGEPGRRQEVIAAQNYIEEYLKEDITVAKMAKFVNMSESRFAHIFKESVGVSFIEYVNQLRIDKAMNYLVHSDMQINEIANEVGISNSNYFSTLFRKRTGTTPLQFRKNANS